MVKKFNTPCPKCGDTKQFICNRGWKNGCTTCLNHKKVEYRNNLLTKNINCSKCGGPREKHKHTWCTKCLRKDMSRRRKKNPKHYTELARKHRNKSYAQKRLLIDSIKANPCMDCKKRFPAPVMQFDHRDGNTKIKAISTLMRNTVKWETIEKEIAKCDLVCANCHAIRTHKRRKGEKV